MGGTLRSLLRDSELHLAGWLGSWLALLSKLRNGAYSHRCTFLRQEFQVRYDLAFWSVHEDHDDCFLWARNLTENWGRYRFGYVHLLFLNFVGFSPPCKAGVEPQLSVVRSYLVCFTVDGGGSFKFDLEANFLHLRDFTWNLKFIFSLKNIRNLVICTAEVSWYQLPVVRTWFALCSLFLKTFQIHPLWARVGLHSS